MWVSESGWVRASSHASRFLESTILYLFFQFALLISKLSFAEVWRSKQVSGVQTLQFQIPSMGQLPSSSLSAIQQIRTAHGTWRCNVQISSKSMLIYLDIYIYIWHRLWRQRPWWWLPSTDISHSQIGKLQFEQLDIPALLPSLPCSELESLKLHVWCPLWQVTLEAARRGIRPIIRSSTHFGRLMSTVYCRLL